MLDAVQSKSAQFEIHDAVFHLDNGVLGGTYTYEWYFDRALGCLQGLLSECGIDSEGMVSYFSIEEVPAQT